jgi:opacity protein-like surface antigen
VNIEFQYDHFGMTGATLNNQEALYNYAIALYNSQNPSNPVSPITGLDGNNHVWSFSLQPIYNVKAGEGVGAYVTGGVGFYHKVANFTEPEEGEYCSPFYGCYDYEANQVIDHYSSNAFGIDVGGGLTYKFSRFANERLFAEVRYVYNFNSYKPGVTIDNVDPSNVSENNFFPYNSQHTSYLPVKFGVRF